jgi:hypothetical protein
MLVTRTELFVVRNDFGFDLRRAHPVVRVRS